MKLMTRYKGYVSGGQKWILKQIWKKERNYFTWFGTFFLNKAINFQINEVWSVVIAQQSECQQLPFFCRYCNLQGGALYLWHIHVAITLIQCCFEHRRRVTRWAPKASLSVYVYCQVLLHTEDENESHIIRLAHFPQSDHELHGAVPTFPISSRRRWFFIDMRAIQL